MAKTKNTNQKKEKGEKPKTPVLSLFFVVFFIVIIPLIYSRNTIDPTVFPRFVAISSGLLVFFTGFFIKKQWMLINGFVLKLPVLFLALFILMTGVAMLFAVNPVEGLADLLKWILVYLIVCAAFVFARQTPNFLHLISKGVIVSAWVAVIIGMAQFFKAGFQNSDPNAMYEVSGLMAHKNQFSVSLFLMLPFLLIGALQLKKGWAKTAWVAFAASVLLIALLQTRAVWIAIAVSGTMAMVGWLAFKPAVKFQVQKKWPRKLAAFLLMTLLLATLVSFLLSGSNPAARIASVFDTKNTSNAWRLEMWMATIDLAKSHACTGVGGGNWKIAVYPYYGKFQPSVYRHWRNAHNDYLQVAAEKGLAGLLLYILFYGSLIYSALSVFRKSAEFKNRLPALLLAAVISGYLIISFFSFPAERMNHLLYIGIISGLVLFMRHHENHTQPPSRSMLGSLFYAAAVVVLLFSLYWGVNTVLSEVYISKAQQLKDGPDKEGFARAARLGHRPLVPFEPRYSFPVLNYSGLAEFMVTRNHEKALEYFKQAYQQHPANFAVINNVGSVYGELGLYDSSIVYYQKTLDIFSHYDQGLLNMAKAWYLKKNYSKAYYYILCCDPKSKVENIEAFRNEVENKLNQ